MRFLKKLLIGVYVYLALFSAATLVIFAVYQTEPTALVTCVFGVAGIESMLGAIIKSSEAKKQKREEVDTLGADIGEH